MQGVKVKESKISGLGLFADQEFNEGDLIGIAHINGKPSQIIGKHHNHSEKPNAHSILLGNKRYIAALRPLRKGEEITVDYRRQPELEQPEEFQNGGITTQEEINAGNTAMMKARLAYAQMHGNPAAQRMVVAPDQPYDFGDGMTGTHYMASMDNYAVPQIQDVNGQLMLGDYGPGSAEAIRFDSDEDANYFAENYKTVSPAFLNEKAKGGERKTRRKDSKGRYRSEDGNIRTPLTPEMQALMSSEDGQYVQEVPEVYTTRTREQQDIRNFLDYQNRMAELNPGRPTQSDAIQPADWLFQLGMLGAAGGIGRSAVGAAEAAGSRALPYITGALETSIPGMASIPGATLGNAAGAYFAGDAIVNRLYPSAGKIQEGKYGEAAADIATGLLDLYGANMLSPVYKGAKATASELGKFLGTEEGLLSNAHKVNPWAFKPDPSKFYRQIGNAGLEDALSSKVIRSADQSTFPRPYFVEGKDFKMLEQTGTGAHGRPTSIFETSGVTNDGLPFVSPANASADYTPWIADMAEVPLTEGRLLKQNWLKGYKEVPKELPGSPNAASSVDDVGKGLTQVPQAPRAAWQMQEMPGLHLRSTMEGQAISKIIEPKTGLVNVEQALAIIDKESGGAEKVALIKQGLGDNIPKKMDFNEFRKVTQDQLIPLETKINPMGRSEYGLPRIGYEDAPPMDMGSVTFSNKSKFGRGSNAHDNPDETLGHAHFLRDAETPDVLTVTQIQSDAFQGTHRVMPKTFDKEQQLRSLAGMEDIAKRQEELKKGAKQIGYDTWELPTGEKLSRNVWENLGSGQAEFNAMKKAEIENFTQKQLLDKNHQERYLQELVDYAGKRGDLNKVRVPTSETAAKVQGYTLVSELNKSKEFIKLRTDIVNALEKYGTNSDQFKKANDIYDQAVKNSKQSYSSEHQTILKKYSEQPKIIKKLFGEEPKIVTDSKGNTWYEFNIPDKAKKGKMEIKAFSTTGAAIGAGAALNNNTQENTQYQNGGEANLFENQKPNSKLNRFIN